MWKKILILFIGLITILVLLELSLRIFGYIHLKSHSNTDNLNGNKYNYTILCVGDSYTAGDIVEKGRNYPVQLEQILNDKTDKKIRVINAGVSGNNTSNIIDKLPEQIEKYKPSLIIFLGGGANQWNLWGFNNSNSNKFLYRLRIYKLFKLLFIDIKQKNSESNYKIETANAINNFKESIKNDSLNSHNYFNLGYYYLYSMKDTANAAIYFKKGLKINPDDIDNYIALNTLLPKSVFADFVNLKEKQKHLLTELYKSLDKNPLNDYYWFLLNTLKPIANNDSVNYLFDKYSKNISNNNTSEKAFKYVIIAHAYDLIDNKNKITNFINTEYQKDTNNISLNYLKGLIYNDNNKNEQADKYFAKCKTIYDNSFKRDKIRYSYIFKSHFGNLSNHNNLFIDYLKKENNNKDNHKGINNNNNDKGDNLVSKWVKNDILKIIDLSKSNNIPIIIQNYPLKHNNLFQKYANEIIYEITNNNPALPFVDNNKHFNLFKENKTDYFEEFDSHPNIKGYNVMAKDIFDKIIQEKLFDVNIKK